jgi:D-methionine transport system ATP-binding protein
MITHQMEVVKEICDRVAIMDDGKIVETNTVESIFRDPKTKTASTFINSMTNVIEDEVINPTDFNGILIRLSYLGNDANQPIVSKIIKQFDINVNILSGNINKLQETNVGHLILELTGDDDQIGKAISQLRSDDVHVEVMQ